MSKWEMVKLGDICDIKSGGTPSRSKNEYWNKGTIPWVKIGDFNGKYLKNSIEKITELGLEKSSAKLFSKGTILYTIFATLGEVTILDIEATSNQAIAGLVPNSDIIDTNYLYYFLKSIKSKINEIGRGVAQNNINLSILKNIEIPYPPLEEQKKIAEELDKINELIEKRKMQIEKMDLLVKAKFIEMFGDPVENPMGWESYILKKLMNKISSGATPKGGKESYITSGIALIRSMNVHNGYFKIDNLAYINNEQAEKLKNVIVERNDVLLNITGASVARSCIVPNDILPARVNQHVAILRCREKINSIYLNKLLTSYTVQKQLLEIGGAGGATREALTKQQIETFKVLLPPIELQNQFADYVQKVESTKARFEKSLIELETLYKQRMQRYFE